MSKVMVVEDDASLREIYSIRITAEGYDVVSAGDGEEALAVAVREKPDLILADVMMPKISGFDMLDILRSTPEVAGIKVIMMTALSGDNQRERGERLGADRYLVKSQIGIEDMINTIHEVLGDKAGAATASTAPANPTPAATSSMTQANQTPAATDMTAPAASAAPAATPVANAAPIPTPQPQAYAPVAPVTPAEGLVAQNFATAAPAQPTTQAVAAMQTPGVQPMQTMTQPMQSAQPVQPQQPAQPYTLSANPAQAAWSLRPTGAQNGQPGQAQ
ncbi:response regulator [Candidatus Saccharibacteria bacterium]|nr:response regulator [Candidatus Saccharibacteria bacterium]